MERDRSTSQTWTKRGTTGETDREGRERVKEERMTRDRHGEELDFQMSRLCFGYGAVASSYRANKAKDIWMKTREEGGCRRE